MLLVAEAKNLGDELAPETLTGSTFKIFPKSEHFSACSPLPLI